MNLTVRNRKTREVLLSFYLQVCTCSPEARERHHVKNWKNVLLQKTAGTHRPECD